jgi:tRNA G18 (ribose-2'-O)-methylase SpoU
VFTKIDDPTDGRLADFIGLRDRELRTRGSAANPQPAVFVAEGDLVIERALRAGYRLRSILTQEGREELLGFEVPEDADRFVAGPNVVTAITGLGVHRGSIAVFDRRPLPDPAEVLANSRRVVVLERVVNPINLGVIARSAAALGVDALILDSSSVDPLYRRASRVAMGEVFDLPFARVNSFPEGLSALHEAGFDTVALTPDPAALDIRDPSWTASERVALVLGSEGPGLTTPTLNECRHRVRIPLSGRVDSLNVGVAASLAFWELTRNAGTTGAQ